MAGLIIGDNNFSTGTLGSGVTFPAGHIVQVQSKKSDTQHTGIETVWTNTGITMEITPKLANSWIHLTGELVVNMTNNTSNAGFSLRWKREQSGQTDAYPAELDDTDQSSTLRNYATHWQQGLPNPTELNWRAPIQGIDKLSHTASTQIIYRLEKVTYSMNGFVLGVGYHGESSFTAYEIAQ